MVDVTVRLRAAAAALLLACAAAVPAAAALAATSAAAVDKAAAPAWVLGYGGQSTNRFIVDGRARGLLQAHVPAALVRDVLNGLHGPPDPVMTVDGRYASMSACEAHACPFKGFFWIDTRTGIALGATYDDGLLRLGSKDVDAAALPAPARRALGAWLADQRLAPSRVEFTGADGRAAALDPAPFMPPPRYAPPPGGPSFDCARAGTAVEKTICATPGLAQQDLALSTVFDEIYHGVDTTAARQRLVALQRGWLKTRDAACAGGADMAACLAAQYRAQDHTLRNWVPGR